MVGKVSKAGHTTSLWLNEELVSEMCPVGYELYVFETQERFLVVFMDMGITSPSWELNAQE